MSNVSTVPILHILLLLKVKFYIGTLSPRINTVLILIFKGVQYNAFPKCSQTFLAII